MNIKEMVSALINKKIRYKDYKKFIWNGGQNQYIDFILSANMKTIEKLYKAIEKGMD